MDKSLKIRPATDDIENRYVIKQEVIDQRRHGNEEQARGIEQIAKAMTQMEQVTQTSATSAQQAASAGESMNAQANSMRKLASELEELIGADAEPDHSVAVTRPTPGKFRGADHRLFSAALVEQALGLLKKNYGAFD